MNTAAEDNGTEAHRPPDASRYDFITRPARPSHVVQFYDDDALLGEAVAQFVGAGLGMGEPVVVIATAGHREALCARLSARAFDLDVACDKGHLTLLDAEETLAAFMVGDIPDAELFRQHVGGALARATRGRSGCVRVHGEMVDVLFAQGKPDAAIRLELLWNEIAADHSFALLCAYAMGHFYKVEDAGHYARICDAHVHSYPTQTSSSDDDDGRLRKIDVLQQRGKTLEAEIARRKELERSLCAAMGTLRQREEEGRKAQEALGEQSRINENLARIATDLASELELDALVQKVTDEATALCRARFGAFFHNVVDEERQSYDLYKHSGVPSEAFPTLPMPRNAVLFQPTFRRRGVERCDDVTNDPRYAQDGPYHRAPEGNRPVRSHLAVQVKSRSGDVLGGLFFGHEEPGVFTESDERVVVAVAAQAAVAIDNAKLFHAAQRAEESARQERAKVEAVAHELENANRAKDDFLATVSHELRTPLNAILGWVRVLRGGRLPDEKKGRALEIIERNANAQTRLIDDLLDVTRIISGKVRLDVATVDLPTVVSHAIESVRPAANAKGVTLQQMTDPDVGTIDGDSERLQQIVWNLLANAVKFTPNGGAVTVTTSVCESHVEIRVADTGHGIEPSFVNQIFERFRQADTSVREHGGLGLGLAIVRHLVELHGGSVSAESEGLGAGATFVVCLPLSRHGSSHVERLPAVRRVAVPTDTRPTQDLDGLHVLVVDDEPDAREAVAELLISCRARVSTAASVAEALRFVREHRPDVVVSDIGMPGEDGYALIKKIRQLPATEGGRTPAIAVTAFARFEDRAQALVAGFDMHVAKPVEPGELTAVLASLTAPSSNS